LAGSVSGGSLRRRLAVDGEEPRVLDWLACVCGVPALGAFLDSMVALAGIERSGSLAFLYETLQQAGGSELWMFAAVISIGPGLGEELFFRGFCQTRLVARYGRHLGIALASLLFGVMHMDPLHSPLALLIGFFLGYMAATFSVKTSITAHMFNNLFATVASAFGPDPEQNPTTATLMGLLGASVFLICFVRVVHRGHARTGRDAHKG